MDGPLSFIILVSTNFALFYPFLLCVPCLTIFYFPGSDAVKHGKTFTSLKYHKTLLGLKILT